MKSGKDLYHVVRHRKTNSQHREAARAYGFKLDMMRVVVDSNNAIGDMSM